MSTVGEDYPHQQARVRELLDAYKGLGPVGRYGAVMLEDLLRRADVAAISGDIVQQLAVYQEMREAK